MPLTVMIDGIPYAPVNNGYKGAKKQLYEFMRAARKQRGLKIHEVAEATGMSVSYYWLVEQGRNQPNMNKYRALIKYFGFRDDYILPWKKADAKPEQSRPPRNLSAC